MQKVWKFRLVETAEFLGCDPFKSGHPKTPFQRLILLIKQLFQPPKRKDKRCMR